MTQIADRLGLNVKRFRQKQGITQKELAVQVGVSKETIGNIEIGRKWVTTRTLSKIAIALEVEQADLFYDPNNKIWTDFVPQLLRMLSMIPPDVLQALGETTDWDYVRRALKITESRNHGIKHLSTLNPIPGAANGDTFP